MKTLKKTLCLVLMLSLVFALMAPGFAFAETKTEMTEEESVETTADGIADILALMAETDEACETSADKAANGWLYNAIMLYVLASAYDAEGDYTEDLSELYDEMAAAVAEDDVTSEDISFLCSGYCVNFLDYIIAELDEEGTTLEAAGEILDALDEYYDDETNDSAALTAYNSYAMCTLLLFTATLLDEEGANTDTLDEILDSVQSVDEETEDSIEMQANGLFHSFLTEAVIVSLFDDAAEADDTTLDLETTVTDSNDEDSDSDDVTDMEELTAAELYLSATLLGVWATCAVDA